MRQEYRRYNARLPRIFYTYLWLALLDRQKRSPSSLMILNIDLSTASLLFLDKPFTRSSTRSAACGHGFVNYTARMVCYCIAVSCCVLCAQRDVEKRIYNSCLTGESETVPKTCQRRHKDLFSTVIRSIAKQPQHNFRY